MMTDVLFVQLFALIQICEHFTTERWLDVILLFVYDLFYDAYTAFTPPSNIFHFKCCALVLNCEVFLTILS